MRTMHHFMPVCYQNIKNARLSFKIQIILLHLCHIPSSFFFVLLKKSLASQTKLQDINIYDTFCVQLFFFLFCEMISAFIIFKLKMYANISFFYCCWCWRHILKIDSHSNWKEFMFFFSLILSRFMWSWPLLIDLDGTNYTVKKIVWNPFIQCRYSSYLHSMHEIYIILIECDFKFL
jgi:hypothetical protein